MTKVKWTMSIVLQNLLRRFVRTGDIISAASNYVPFLQNIFDDKTDAKFVVKEIEREKLEEAQSEACFKRYPTIEVSDKIPGYCVNS